MAETMRAYPRSSWFEALLARVALELWDLQDNPVPYVNRVKYFVRTMPSIYRERIPNFFPGNYEEETKKLDAKLVEWDIVKSSADALDASTIDAVAKPAEELEFAIDVWSAIVDVLTDAGFSFPMSKEAAPSGVGKWRKTPETTTPG